MVAGQGARNEDFPVAGATHAHGMPAAIPEIEVADDADPPRVGGMDSEADAGHAIDGHTMGAELLVEIEVSTFAEQMQIEIRQDRRKAIGVVELGIAVTKPGMQPVAHRPVRQLALEQPRLMDTREAGRMAVRLDGFDFERAGQEGAHHRRVTLGMGAKIVKRIGMAALDDRIGFVLEFGHAVPRCRDSTRKVPASGTRSQSGRWASSYSIS